MKFINIVQIAMYPNIINATKVKESSLAWGYLIRMCVVTMAMRMKCIK